MFQETPVVSSSPSVTTHRSSPPGPPIGCSADQLSPPSPILLPSNRASPPGPPLLVQEHRTSPPATPSTDNTAQHSSNSGQSTHVKEKTTEIERNIKHDHNYILTDSPRRMKRRLDDTVNQLEQMKKKLDSKKKTMSKLKKKVESLDTIVSSLKEHDLISDKVARTLEKSFSGVSKEIWARGQKKKGTTAVYPESLKSFALTLQFYSNKAYKYVRESFDLLLPHPSHLRKWYSVIQGKYTFKFLVGKVLNFILFLKKLTLRFMRTKCEGYYDLYF